MLEKIDLVETWLNTVAFNSSGSKGTTKDCRFAFKRFCNFIEKTPQQILAEYEGTDDRTFKRRYAMYLRAFIQVIQKGGYAHGTIRKMTFNRHFEATINLEESGIVAIFFAGVRTLPLND